MSTDLLASWNDTPTRRAIVDFVESAAQNVAPEDRIAVFDNDGTLWAEKPMPTELVFVLERLAAMVEADASLGDRQPWKAAHEKDYAWLGGAMEKHYAGDDTDLHVLMGGMHRGLCGRRRGHVRDLRGPVHQPAPSIPRPHLRRHRLRANGRAPALLEANGFTTLIASGGSRDFMRGFAADVYGLGPERVIGSSNELAFVEDEHGGSVVYQEKPDVFDDGPAKPVRIWSRLGRRPLISGGNSNGDIPMLQFAGTPTRPGLRLLVLHDDAEREFDYVQGAEQALNAAKADGWTVISMKNDWSTVFVEPTG